MGENSSKTKKLYLLGGDQKEDTLLNHVEISVVESEKRTNGSLHFREFYTTYLIETKCTDLEFHVKLSKISTVWRRYSEFETVHDYLEHTYPYIVVPPLPEKRVLFSWQKVSTDTFDPDFVDRRRAALETFLLRVASHPILGWNKIFIEFLQHDTWKGSLESNGYWKIAENKLKSLSVSTHRLKNPNSHFETLKSRRNSMHTCIYNMLKARSRVAEKQYNVYKLHQNYGRVFSEWSAIEKEMGDALQKTGHYLDSLSSSVDGLLEDEELLVDQFKEYLFFAVALQQICRNHETLLVKLENAEENVSAKNAEKTRAIQGKIGIMSRLFGTIDTEEVREMKVNDLDQQIHEATEAVNQSKSDLTEFCSKALTDVDRFQVQKAADLKETLVAFALLQLKAAKKGLQTWTQIRNCLQNIPS
nr:sorting nexin-4-like [Onthophagus taurus]